MNEAGIGSVRVCARGPEIRGSETFYHANDTSKPQTKPIADCLMHALYVCVCFLTRHYVLKHFYAALPAARNVQNHYGSPVRPNHPCGCAADLGNSRDPAGGPSD